LRNLIIFTFQTLVFLLKAKVRINKAEKKFESSATIAEISSFWGYLSFNNKLDLFKSSKDFFLFFQRFWIFIIVDVSPFVSTKNTYQGKTMESFFLFVVENYSLDFEPFGINRRLCSEKTTKWLLYKKWGLWRLFFF